MPEKVVLIGLDGVDFRLIEPWVKANKLPNIETILSDGAWAQLETCPPHWTIPNWNVITTGKTPGTLGIYDFMLHDRTSHTSHPYFTWCGDGNPLWRYVELGGGKSCIGNVPSLHTPTEIKGVSLVGWLPASDDDLTYPPSIQTKIHELVDGYQLDVKSVNIEEGKVHSNWDNKTQFLEQLNSLTEDRMKVFNYLYQLDEWEFFMPVFTGTDRINHALWEDKGNLLDYYIRIDQWIGSLLERINDDTVIGLVSDHGFSGHEKILYLNELLERKGLLARAKPKRKTRASLLSRFVNSGRDHLPAIIKEVVPDGVRDSLMSVAETSFKDSNIDWENTTAYCTSVSGTVFVDTQEGNGDKLCKKVADTLTESLKNQGMKTEEFRIHRTSEIYESTERDAPELIVEFDNVDINTGFRESGGDCLITRPIHGNHHRTGLLAFHGDGIQSGEYLSASVTDVAPSVLYLLGCPIPTDMDGEVLFDMFTEDFCKESIEELRVEPLETPTMQSMADHDSVESRLESLGYL